MKTLGSYAARGEMRQWVWYRFAWGSFHVAELLIGASQRGWFAWKARRCVLPDPWRLSVSHAAYLLGESW